MNNIMFRPMSDVHVESHPEGWRVPLLHGVPESEVVCLLAGDIVDRCTEKYDRFIRDLIGVVDRAVRVGDAGVRPVSHFRPP